MIEKSIKSKLSECVTYRYTPTTQNLDSICVKLSKEGKTYAEYQKEQYRRFYDVKTYLDYNIEKMHNDYEEREKKRLFNEIVRIFKKEVK